MQLSVGLVRVDWLIGLYYIYPAISASLFFAIYRDFFFVLFPSHHHLSSRRM